MQAQGLFAQNGWCSSVRTGLCYTAMDAGRPFVSEDREVFRGIGNFFMHFQISYWRRTISYYRGLLDRVAVPRKLGLGGRSNSVERDLLLKKKVLLCLRSIISCACNKPCIIFQCASDHALQLERAENIMCNTKHLVLTRYPKVLLNYEIQFTKDGYMSSVIFCIVNVNFPKLFSPADQLPFSSLALSSILVPHLYCSRHGVVMEPRSWIVSSAYFFQLLSKSFTNYLPAGFFLIGPEEEAFLL